MIELKLKKGERKFLMVFLKKGLRKSRAIARANVLLLLDEGYDTDTISKATRIHRQTIWRIKKRYLEEGLEATLEEKPRSGQPKKYKDLHEATIIAVACTSPPHGRQRWTIELLTERLKRKKDFRTINRETVRLVLKKAKLSLG